MNLELDHESLSNQRAIHQKDSDISFGQIKSSHTKTLKHVLTF